MTGDDRSVLLGKRAAAILLVVYGGLVIYTSLLPFTGWQVPQVPVFELKFWLSAPTNRKDMLINSLVYIPFGFLGGYRFAFAFSRTFSVAAATILGMVVSFAMETCQAFLPARDTSLSDLLLNSAGACTGAVLSQLREPAAWLRNARDDLQRRSPGDGPLTDLGLLVLGVWALGRIFPFVPNHSVSGLKHGFSLAVRVMHDPSLFQFGTLSVHILELFGLGVVPLSIARDRRRALCWYGLLVVPVLLLQGFVMTRQMTAEALAGALVAVPALLLVCRLPARTLHLCGIAALLISAAVKSLLPGTGMAAGFGSMNWVPFAYHETLEGITAIIAACWKFIGIGFLCRLTWPGNRSVKVGGALVSFTFMFTLEWLQQYIPGRTADVTDGVLAGSAWCLAWLLSAGAEKTEQGITTHFH